jgi:hypothetical protein
MAGDLSHILPGEASWAIECREEDLVEGFPVFLNATIDGISRGYRGLWMERFKNLARDGVSMRSRDPHHRDRSLARRCCHGSNGVRVRHDQAWLA